MILGGNTNSIPNKKALTFSTVEPHIYGKIKDILDNKINKGDYQ